MLLNEDQLANLDSSTAATAKKNGKKPAGQAVQNDTTVRELWNEEGDDFFGHTAPPQVAVATSGDVVEEEGTPKPSGGRGKKRRGNGDGSRRKPGPKPGTRKKAQPAAAEVDA